MSATNNATSIDGWAHDAHMLLGGEWPIQWSEIKVPVLLVGYTRDRFATPHLIYALSEYLKKRGIKVNVEIREGGHFTAAKDQKNVDIDVRRLLRMTG
jgi:predicted esterase